MASTPNVPLPSTTTLVTPHHIITLTDSLTFESPVEQLLDERIKFQSSQLAQLQHLHRIPPYKRHKWMKVPKNAFFIRDSLAGNVHKMYKRQRENQVRGLIHPFPPSTHHITRAHTCTIHQFHEAQRKVERIRAVVQGARVLCVETMELKAVLEDIRDQEQRVLVLNEQVTKHARSHPLRPSPTSQSVSGKQNH